MEFVIVTGFFLGLTANFHCLGMCGPIALMIPVDRTSNWSIAAGLVQYHTGRIAVYGLFGAVLGMVGLTMQFIGWLQWLSIISGVLLILMAWKHLLRFPAKQSGSLGWFLSKLQSVRSTALRSKSPFKLAILGAINGFLPCGMIYVALVNAVLAGDFVSSSLAMVSFGIGTLPILVIVAFFGSKFKSFKSAQWSKLMPYFLTALGLLIVMRGMNLGIKYISPKISIHQSKDENNEMVKEEEMSCCHTNVCAPE